MVLHNLLYHSQTHARPVFFSIADEWSKQFFPHYVRNSRTIIFDADLQPLPYPSQTDVYFGLEMNARAVLYDYVSIKSAQYVLKRFNMQGVQLATFIDGTLNARGDKDKGWSLEVAIPWANFEALAQRPTVGTVWAANINRWDGVEPDRRMSNWSDPVQPKPNPHVPARFGQLVFVM